MKRYLSAVVLFGMVNSSAFAGGTAGPATVKSAVKPAATEQHEFNFLGREEAIVTLNGGENIKIAVYVFDEAGRLVASNENSSKQSELRWLPLVTSKYVIKVVNLGQVSTPYQLLTN